MKLIQRAAMALAILLTTQAHAAPAPEPGAVDAPEGSIAIPLYGKGNPGNPADESLLTFGKETLLRGITYPTLTPVLPDPGKANGTAVIVAPGGGFLVLAMQNEGWRVAKALADRGVTAFVLKYRLRQPVGDPMLWLQTEGQKLATARSAGKSIPVTNYAPSVEDGLAAVKLVRARAAEWQIDPKRVGVIGFSAGAMTALQTVLQAPKGDPLAGPPDFIGYIYGPMGAVSVPDNAPAMFAAIAMDDELFGNGDFSIISNWQLAKKPVELHAYQSGGHGFGLGKPGTTSTELMPDFLAWMETNGLLTKR
jgi:acetyl esterase/lipase